MFYLKPTGERDWSQT